MYELKTRLLMGKRMLWTDKDHGNITLRQSNIVKECVPMPRVCVHAMCVPMPRVCLAQSGAYLAIGTLKPSHQFTLDERDPLVGVHAFVKRCHFGSEEALHETALWEDHGQVEAVKG